MVNIQNDKDFMREFPAKIIKEWMRACPTVELDAGEKETLHFFLANIIARYEHAICTIFASRIAALKEQADLYACLDLLRGEEGDSVLLVCDNPDPLDESQNHVVVCFGGWTNWLDKRFQGRTQKEAITNAVVAYKHYQENHVAILPDRMASVADLAAIPLSDEQFRGALAFALTRRRIIDMPTARALVDEAIDEAVELRYGQIVEGIRDKFKGRIIGYYRSLEGQLGVVVQELGTKIKHIYDRKNVRK